MAFYFALLNVSAKRDEKIQKHRRRRHSIASVESPLLDYRLLPRPQIVGQEDVEEGIDFADEPSSSRQRNEKGMRKSDSTYSAGRATRTRKKDHSDGEAVEQRRAKENKKKSFLFGVDESTKARNTVILAETFKKEKGSDEKKQNLRHKPSGREHRSASNKEYPCKIAAAENAKEKEFPHVRVRKCRLAAFPRSASPESTTSGSRRSSKGSQNSLQRRDTTPSSSSCSRRPSDEPCSATGLFQAGLKLSGLAIHKSKSTDKLIEPKTPQYKKVTFDNANAPFIITNDFLGDRAVLLKEARGSAVLRRASTAAQPLAACGTAWWGLCANEPDYERTQNRTNVVIENESRKQQRRSCLLRRRSTSDRGRVPLTFRNNGYTEGSPDKTPEKPPELRRYGTMK